MFSALTPAMAETLKLVVTDVPGLAVGGLPARKAAAQTFTLGTADVGAIDFLLADVRALAPGAAGLVGQNVLGLADVEYDLPNGVIRLFQPQGCDAGDGAYWAKGWRTAEMVAPSPASRLIQATVSINGRSFRASLDTAAPVSVLSLAAAVRLGLTGREMEPTEPAKILGRAAPTWTAPAASFSLGGEAWRNTRLRIVDADLGEGVDMLIGADFLAAHRVYVATARRRIYFTYYSGPIFAPAGPPPAKR